MYTRLQEIHDYLIRINTDPKILMKLDSDPITLAMEIAEYAHKSQYRDNGEAYVLHPKRLFLNYRHWLDHESDEEKFHPIDMLICRLRIPYEGVEPLCLLHDVVEDTDFTFEDIQNIYYEASGGCTNYFDTFLKEPLKNITHDKSMPYEDYIKICKKHPISAIVKLLDLQDNLNVTSLKTLDKETYKRTRNYLKYIKSINDKYHFIEKIDKYIIKSEYWLDYSNFD